MKHVVLGICAHFLISLILWDGTGEIPALTWLSGPLRHLGLGRVSMAKLGALAPSVQGVQKEFQGRSVLCSHQELPGNPLSPKPLSLSGRKDPVHPNPSFSAFYWLRGTNSLIP